MRAGLTFTYRTLQTCLLLLDYHNEEHLAVFRMLVLRKLEVPFVANLYMFNARW